MRAFALALVLGLGLGVGSAGALEVRLSAEVTGGPGWRVAAGQDPRAPGFNAVTGGADALLGIALGNIAGLVVGGRVRGGSEGDDSYLEVTGDLGAQLHIGDRVRARVGGNAGRAWIRGSAISAPLVGGWTALSFDLVSLANGRVAVALSVRLDVGAFPGGGERFPEATVQLCGGLGGRY
jgi:hypothetical protein